jgi:hypothetical protein
MKKKYYYNIDSKTGRNTGGYKVVASVYTVKAGKIMKLGQVRWDTGMTKGERSEVFEFLKNKKLVTAKEYKANNGYYMASKSKVDIDSL